MPRLQDPDAIRDVLGRARTVAVLGATRTTHKAGHYVPAYLQGQGYRILPVNPAYVGEEMFGSTVVATLADLPEPVDILDVFRHPRHLPAHTAEILAMAPSPRVVWLQLGVRDKGMEAALLEAGLTVVADRCTLADHQRLGVGPVG